MSFQDFGSRPSVSNRLGAAPSSGGSSNSAQQRAPTSGIPISAATTMGQGSLNQISESLLQYQRNVGILEKIVHSLTAPSSSVSTAAASGRNNMPNYYRNGNREEVELQYQAQVDVISQLGIKVHRLISDQKKSEQNPTIRTTLIKLERDFDRVQKQAEALTGAVTRMRAAKNSAAASANARQESNSALEAYQQQILLQMQEDRLAEQIMREREEEIRKINRGMHQVNEIYKDLAHIVASQQDQVDAIETQMEESRANADAGLVQIEKANEHYGASNCVIS